jgi:hypothetical protein
MCASQATTSAAVFRSRRLQSSGTPECELETPIRSCCDAPAETPTLLSPCTPTPSLASECQCPVSALHSHVVASAREPAIRRCLDPPPSSTCLVRDLVAAYGETNLSTCNLTVLSMSALNQLSAHPSCRHFLDATQVSFEDLQRYFQTITNPTYIVWSSLMRHSGKQNTWLLRQCFCVTNFCSEFLFAPCSLCHIPLNPAPARSEAADSAAAAEQTQAKQKIVRRVTSKSGPGLADCSWIGKFQRFDDDDFWFCVPPIRLQRLYEIRMQKAQAAFLRKSIKNADQPNTIQTPF